MNEQELRSVENKEILQKLRKYLYKQFTRRDFSKICQISNDLSDAVKEQCNTEEEDQFYKNKSCSNRDGFIINSLGHISANPNLKDKTLLLKNTYVYVNESNPDLKINKKYPNSNTESSCNFMQSLIENSRNEYNIYLNRKNDVRKIFLLSGDRGVGKTYFINHLFTKFNSDLNKNNIIWIRLNLVEDFGKSNINLIHWIRSKIALVILRYYYPQRNSKFKTIYEDLTEIIEELDDFNDKSDLFDNLHKIKEIFSGQSREVLTENTVKDIIARKISELVIKKYKCSFIFILDGFDKLDITTKHIDKFKNLISEINDFVSPDTKLGGSILIVTREETKEYLKTSSHPTLKKWNTEYFTIKNIEISKIIDKRIEYLIKRVKEKAKNQKWTLFDWPDHIEFFKSYLTEISDRKNYHDFLFHLDEIYGSNNRAKVQLVQLSYFSFLCKEKHEKVYKLIESMCRGGYIFPPKIYKYTIVENKINILSCSKIFDNVFLPTVTIFPYCPSCSKYKLPLCGTPILSNFRILQIILAYNKMDRNVRSHGINGGVLIEYLHTYFKYDKNILYFQIEELFEYHMIRFNPGLLMTPDNLKDLEIIPTPKLKFIFDNEVEKQEENYISLVSDIAYLNMCSMRTLINKQFLKGDYPYFKAIYYDDNNPNLEDWVFWKIINSINLVRILRSANKFEQVKIIKLGLHKNNIDLYNSISFDFLNEKVPEGLFRKVKYIINELGPKRRSNFQYRLNKYLEKGEF